MDLTPKLKPSFGLSRFRKSSKNTSPCAAYKSPLNEVVPSSSSENDILEYDHTPKRPCCSDEKTGLLKKMRTSNFKELSLQAHKSSGLQNYSKDISLYQSPISISSVGGTNEKHERTLIFRKNVTVGEKPIEALKVDANTLSLKLSQVSEEIDALKEKGYAISQLKWYIDKLHEYNDIKDVAQMVMGRIAVAENVSLKDVHNLFSVNHND